MGFQMTAFMQKRTADGGWENIPVEGMDYDEPEQVKSVYYRDVIHGQKHWDWLGMGSLVDMEEFIIYSDVIHSPRKGLPDDLTEYERQQLELCDYGYNWHMLDELLATDWDVVHQSDDNINGPKPYTLREFLGQPFIDWLTDLKSMGVERIVCAFG